MITKFKLFEKSVNTGIFGVKIDGEYMNFHLVYDENEVPINIDIYQGDKKYQDLSIVVQENEELDRKEEFYINPDVKKEIVDVLIKQGFIEKTEKTIMAGDIMTSSYILIA